MSQLHIIDHPMIQHKLSIMRDIHTGSKDFRQLLTEISLLMGYEVTRDLPLEPVEIETPMRKMTARVISGKKLAIVPILRAGLGMVDGLLTLLYTALALRKRTYACEHARAYKKIAQRFAHAGSMRTDDIVLQITQVRVVHAPLRHRSETRVDAVDHLVAGELGQETVAGLHGGHGLLIYLQTGLAEEDITH